MKYIAAAFILKMKTMSLTTLLFAGPTYLESKSNRGLNPDLYVFIYVFHRFPLHSPSLLQTRQCPRILVHTIVHPVHSARLSCLRTSCHFVLFFELEFLLLFGNTTKQMLFLYKVVGVIEVAYLGRASWTFLNAEFVPHNSNIYE